MARRLREAGVARAPRLRGQRLELPHHGPLARLRPRHLAPHWAVRPSSSTPAATARARARGRRLVQPARAARSARRPTAQTGDPLVDALLWIKRPGESDGACNGGPPAGTWWPEDALGARPAGRGGLTPRGSGGSGPRRAKSRASGGRWADERATHAPTSSEGTEPSPPRTPTTAPATPRPGAGRPAPSPALVAHLRRRGRSPRASSTSSGGGASPSTGPRSGSAPRSPSPRPTASSCSACSPSRAGGSPRREVPRAAGGPLASPSSSPPTTRTRTSCARPSSARWRSATT